VRGIDRGRERVGVLLTAVRRREIALLRLPFLFIDAKRIANDYDQQFESSADFDRPASV
jgi:hypothetical protein